MVQFPIALPRPVIVTCVKNPFDPLNNTEMRTFAPGRPVREYLNEFVPYVAEEYEIAISINGALIESEACLDLVCSPNMSLVFCATPQGGDTLKTIAMLAVIIIAAVATAYVGGLGGWVVAGIEISAEVAGMVAGMAVMMIGSLLINALIPATAADASLISSSDTTKSSTYGWGVTTNKNEEGIPVPVFYGTRRVTPPCIGRYIELSGDSQYLNLLYLVADHAVDSITDIRIAGTDIADYGDVSYETRLGTLDQSVLQYFGDSRYEKSIYTELSTSWVKGSGFSSTVDHFPRRAERKGI